MVGINQGKAKRGCDPVSALLPWTGSLTSLAHHFLNSKVSFNDLRGVLRCYALLYSVGELPHYEETLPAVVTLHLVPYSPG